MKAAWTNAPMNLPQKRKDPALGTLVVMISVIALMFGIRFFCQPQGELEDIAAMLEIETSTAEPETKAEDRSNPM